MRVVHFLGQIPDFTVGTVEILVVDLIRNDVEITPARILRRQPESGLDRRVTLELAQELDTCLDLLVHQRTLIHDITPFVGSVTASKNLSALSWDIVW